MLKKPILASLLTTSDPRASPSDASAPHASLDAPLSNKDIYAKLFRGVAAGAASFYNILLGETTQKSLAAFDAPPSRRRTATAETPVCRNSMSSLLRNTSPALRLPNPPAPTCINNHLKPRFEHALTSRSVPPPQPFSSPSQRTCACPPLRVFEDESHSYLVAPRCVNVLPLPRPVSPRSVVGLYVDPVAYISSFQPATCRTVEAFNARHSVRGSTDMSAVSSLALLSLMVMFSFMLKAYFGWWNELDGPTKDKLSPPAPPNTPTASPAPFRRGTMLENPIVDGQQVDDWVKEEIFNLPPPMLSPVLAPEKQADYQSQWYSSSLEDEILEEVARGIGAITLEDRDIERIERPDYPEAHLPLDNVVARALESAPQERKPSNEEKPLLNGDDVERYRADDPKSDAESKVETPGDVLPCLTKENTAPSPRVVANVSKVLKFDKRSLKFSRFHRMAPDATLTNPQTSEVLPVSPARHIAGRRFKASTSLKRTTPDDKPQPAWARRRIARM